MWPETRQGGRDLDGPARRTKWSPLGVGSTPTATCFICSHKSPEEPLHPQCPLWSTRGPIRFLGNRKPQCVGKTLRLRSTPLAKRGIFLHVCLSDSPPLPNTGKFCRCPGSNSLHPIFHVGRTEG